MNTSAQHLLNLPSTPQEGDLREVQNSHIQSIQGVITTINGKVGDAIEVMKVMKEKFLEKQKKIEEIVLAIEEAGNIQLDDFSRLIQKTGNVNANDPTGRTALFRAASIGYLEIVQLLLTHPEIQVNEKDSGEETALMVAVKCGYLEITKLLLARPEIQINEKSSPGLTVLMWAVKWGHLEITKLLLARPEIFLNEKSSNGLTAFIFAALEGHKNIIQLLLADSRLNLREYNQGIEALEQAKTPEIRSLIEEAMKKQGIPF